MITRIDWNGMAVDLARHARSTYQAVPRGVLPVRLLDESASPPQLVEDGPLVLALFGNDGYQTNPLVFREVELLRRLLRQTPARELGFGLSQDGQCWAILVGMEHYQYETAAGRTLQKDLYKIGLEQLLAHAWQAVSGPANPATAIVA